MKLYVMQPWIKGKDSNLVYSLVKVFVVPVIIIIMISAERPGAPEGLGWSIRDGGGGAPGNKPHGQPHHHQHQEEEKAL